MLNKRRVLLLIAIFPFLPGLIVCLVMLFRNSRNPINDLITLAAFAATVVIVNVGAVRISRARAMRNSSFENNS